MIKVKDGLVVVTLNWEFLRLGVIVVSTFVFVAGCMAWVASVNRLRKQVADMDTWQHTTDREVRALREKVAGWDAVLRVRHPQ